MLLQVSFIMRVILFTSFISFGYSFDLAFQKNEKCGCNLDYIEYLPYGPCSTDVRCKSDDIEFEAFDPIDVNTCTDWYLDGYNVSFTNDIDGTLNVTILLSPSLFYERVQYDVKLLLTNHPNSSSNIHSTKTLRVDGKKFASCQKVIVLSFPFLFSGNYILKVVRTDRNARNVTINSACTSRELFISSPYEKKLLHSLTPVVYPKLVPQNQYFHLHLSGGGISLARKVYILLGSPDCEGANGEWSMKVQMKYPRPHGTGEGCCATSPADMAYCPCEWKKNGKQIECKFESISNGSYCISIGFYDPRCKASTLWTEGATANCVWSISTVLNGSVSSTIYEEILENPSSSVIILGCSVGFISLIIFVSIWMAIIKPKCIKKFSHGLNDYSTNSLMSHTSKSFTISSSNKKEDVQRKVEKMKRTLLCQSPKVLLLYPRDCDAFMIAMASFRSFLTKNNCQVYDPWDDSIYDEVVESCETWTLPFFRNEDVKIIVVLSECAKKFEKAFLDNSTLLYENPQSLDVIFPQSLSMIHQYFANRFDSYQRIFVVRLEGSPRTFDFITPATVYTLPEGFRNLMEDLLSFSSDDIGLNEPFLQGQQEYYEFKQSATDYNNLQTSKNGYLNYLLHLTEDT